MQSINFRTARGNLSEVLNNVEAGEEVEITRRGREPAVIVSKATFEAYKKAALDAEFASLFGMLNLHPCLTPWTPPTRNWLTDNEAYITGRTYCAS
ncbi:type II toxin-antitoxin system Phd/YefM family antitoxin (plasmid) [Escherichia coli]|uniref:type II toxin-antitoxin system Phd/YefM family antitoxin n=1 Tax=Escherichia coli TaxID=562 RepID=UPI00260CB303|nr:type II toxin-antitoxin system Phd/YefM family antitoxin [Escherichia coli]WKB06342.1 type II toxin-antitoxin system Phd/YefM family antitoxin [Escherichia coli]